MRAFSIALVLIAGCSYGGPSPRGDDDGSGGAPDARPPRPDAEPVDPQEPPVCGDQELPLERTAPQLLIVLDQSGSMAEPPPSGTGERWDAATAALEQTVMATDTQIEWGIEFFPTDGMCGVEEVAVGVEIDNYVPIRDAMNAREPEGGTPTRAAIQKATAYLQSAGAGSSKHILLATDGDPTCSAAACEPPCWVEGQSCCCSCGPSCTSCQGGGGGPDAPATIDAIRTAADAGIETYVIGLADGLSEDTLNDMAQAGGTARAGGPPYYYPVASQDELEQVISTITGGIVSCTFELAAPPPDPDFVTVTVDGVEVPRDPSHSDGWDLGPGNTSIEFYGEWCDRLRDGATAVQAVFRCPPDPEF